MAFVELSSCTTFYVSIWWNAVSRGLDRALRVDEDDCFPSANAGIGGSCLESSSLQSAIDSGGDACMSTASHRAARDRKPADVLPRFPDSNGSAKHLTAAAFAISAT